MITEHKIERLEFVSAKSFEAIIAELKAVIGQPNIQEFLQGMRQAADFSGLEKVVNDSLGSSGFMQFMQLDLGQVLRKKTGSDQPKTMRFIIGNPLIMAQITAENVEAGLSAPITILVSEQADGVHLLYDKMSSHFVDNQDSAGARVARQLDEKVEKLLAGVSETN